MVRRAAAAEPTWRLRLAGARAVRGQPRPRGCQLLRLPLRPLPGANTDLPARLLQEAGPRARQAWQLAAVPLTPVSATKHLQLL